MQDGSDSSDRLLWSITGFHSFFPSLSFISLPQRSDWSRVVFLFSPLTLMQIFMEFVTRLGCFSSSVLYMPLVAIPFLFQMHSHCFPDPSHNLTILRRFAAAGQFAHSCSGSGIYRFHESIIASQLRRFLSGSHLMLLTQHNLRPHDFLYLESSSFIRTYFLIAESILTCRSLSYVAFP